MKCMSKMNIPINIPTIKNVLDKNGSPPAIFDTDEEKIWVKRVGYDIEGAIAAIEAQGLPAILGERLRLGK